jgi:dienelactone hydrolase
MCRATDLFSVLISFCLLVCLLAAPSGCGGGDDDGAPPLDPGGCDLPAYSWLPRSEVGALLDYEEDLLSPLTAAGIDSLLFDEFEYFKPVPYGARVYRFRYTTQDKGQPVEATGLVGVPYSDQGVSGEFPLVLWLHGTSGFMGQCAPSASINEYVLVAYLLSSLGYVVAAPDFIGLDAGAEPGEPPPERHVYIGIEQTAVGSLDSLPAARALIEAVADPGVTLREDLVIWGASQGGHAAMAVDLLAPYYAPRLDVLATVALVPPSDLLGLADYAVSSYNPATEAVAAVLVSAHYWYEGSEPFDALLSSVTPWDVANTFPEAMYSGCDSDAVFDGATAVEHVYASDLLDTVADGWESAEPWACYLRENSFATTSIPRLSTTPTLYVVSENDNLVYSPVCRADFDRLCAEGYQLEYLECADAGHADGALWSMPEQVAWVNARLAGDPIDPARLCQQSAPVRCTGQPVQ